MFCGIVTELGEVEAVDADAGRLRVRCAEVLQGARAGDSVAVNGCCLTVVDLDGAGFGADVVPETLARTTLGALRPGERVNLEAAMRQDARVGGHLVSGHVDGVGTVTTLRAEGNSVRAVIAAPERILPLLAEKGCVAVDGISLTVAAVDGRAFSVALVPHTRAVTTAGRWQEGTAVNLEADLVARYVERNVAAHLGAVAPRLRRVS